MGLMWALCGLLEKKDLRKFWRTFKAFNIFVVVSWNEGRSWRTMCYITKE